MHCKVIIARMIDHVDESYRQYYPANFYLLWKYGKNVVVFCTIDSSDGPEWMNKTAPLYISWTQNGLSRLTSLAHV